MKKIKLGIIGMSEGNGHPYSWSAIFNGYHKKYMKDCPFPVIPEYLSKRKFPKDQIVGAEVTHIWTQNKSISEHISKAAKINSIVKEPEDLINSVDAILLARDDYDLHYNMAKPFIEAGIPIYIDKPIATTVKETNKIFALERYQGQIFTCSAIQYAKEFNISDENKQSIGKLHHIEACIRGPWDKYSIHIIEPVIKIMGNQGEIDLSNVICSDYNTHLSLRWTSGLTTIFSTFINIPSPLVIRIWGELGFKELVFEDTYTAFKLALLQYISIINKTTKNTSKEFSQKSIEILERGLV